MLKINALKININTNKGLYGINIKFEEGLNIIRGNNSSGKSTIFQSILFCLGLEEIIGSKNDKAMQSVLRDEILNDERIHEADVLESAIFLEITNGKEPITIERFVKSENVDTRFLRVHSGAILTESLKNIPSSPMFVHDSGGAKDVKFGFHAFLEQYLDLSLPEVQYNDGAFRKLYLQTIFPAIIIEQKVGWSDFLATIPYYNLRDKEKRAIEFILKLDSWKIEEKRQEIKSRKQEVERYWENKVSKIRDLARRAALEIEGLNLSPVIINDSGSIFLRYNTPDKSYGIDDYLYELSLEVERLEKLEIPKIETISKEKEKELSKAESDYQRFNVQYNRIFENKGNIKDNLTIIKERLKQIEQELEQNKYHLKVKRLGNLEELKVSADLCPACGHELNDSLLPNNSEQIPMNIEENIGYLEAQKSMAITYIKSHEIDLRNESKQLVAYEEAISQIRVRIRSIKRDLISDGRLPSVELIEKRIKEKNKLEFYLKVRDEFDKLKEELLTLSKSWQEVLADGEKLPKDSFSKEDKNKIYFLKDEFIRLLKKFDYGSKSLENLGISWDKLLPVADGQYSIKYDLRFDSSASDLVRAISAFTCALYCVSNKYNGNHPSFLMFDEPGTQDTANTTLKELFDELQSYKAQVIVFASFKQSDADFRESTEGLKFNLIQREGRKFIRKMDK